MNHEVTKNGLSTEQQKILVDIISDQFGHTLTRENFAEQVLLLFEDISGFEMISDSDSIIIINQLWRNYHGPEK